MATASAASAAMTMTSRSWLRDDGASTLVVADRVTPEAFASACTAVSDESTRPVGLGSTFSLASTARSPAPFCPGRLNPNPFGITTSSRFL